MALTKIRSFLGRVKKVYVCTQVTPHRLACCQRKSLTAQARTYAIATIPPNKREPRVLSNFISIGTPPDDAMVEEIEPAVFEGEDEA